MIRHSDALAQAAQQAAEEQARQAHLTILCLDVTQPLNPWEREMLRTVPAGRSAGRVDQSRSRRPTRDHGVPGAIYTSSRTGEGLEALRTLIARRLSDSHPTTGAAVVSTAVRCRRSLESAAARLRTARQLVAERAGEELVAVELRDALDELGQVVGAVYTDDILDRIFSRFCIGK